MYKKRSLLAVVALACVLALAIAVFAQAPGRRGRQGQAGLQGGMGPGPGMRAAPCPTRTFMPPGPEVMDRIAQELALTDEQKAKSKELLEALRIKVQEIASKGQPVQDLIAELKSPTTDAAKVQALGAAATKKEAEILQAELDALVNLEKLLTAEQQTKFWDLVLRRTGPPAPGGAPPPPQQ